LLYKQHFVLSILKQESKVHVMTAWFISISIRLVRLKGFYAGLGLWNDSRLIVFEHETRLPDLRNAWLQCVFV